MSMLIAVVVGVHSGIVPTCGCGRSRNQGISFTGIELSFCQQGLHSFELLGRNDVVHASSRASSSAARTSVELAGSTSDNSNWNPIAGARASINSRASAAAGPRPMILVSALNRNHPSRATIETGWGTSAAAPDWALDSPAIPAAHKKPNAKRPIISDPPFLADHGSSNRPARTLSRASDNQLFERRQRPLRSRLEKGR